jgi:HSP20 family protein
MARSRRTKRAQPKAGAKAAVPAAAAKPKVSGAAAQAVPVSKPKPAAPARKSAGSAAGASGSLSRRFAEQMDRAFADFRRDWSLFPRSEREAQRERPWLPAVEVLERGGKLLVRADLPGLRKEDVKVELRADSLAIHGERREEREEKRKGYYRSERSYGSFYREVPLPEGIDPEQAKATFENGVLEVTLPAPKGRSEGRTLPVD